MVTVTFSEAMKTTVNPTLAFSPTVASDADVGQRQLDGQHPLRGDVRRGGRERGGGQRDDRRDGGARTRRGTPQAGLHAG